MDSQDILKVLATLSMGFLQNLWACLNVFKVYDIGVLIRPC